MKAPLWFLLGAACGAVIIAAPKAIAHLHAAVNRAQSHNTSAGEARAHTSAQFEFIANGTMGQVAPLFGADKERVWADDWNPAFLNPLPPADQEGMVFTIDHHHRHAVWINTQLDLRNGHVCYVYVVPDAMATLIRLRLTPEAEKTRVAVTYERTALSAEADAHVLHLADGDRASGLEWEKAVNAYLHQQGK